MNSATSDNSSLITTQTVPASSQRKQLFAQPVGPCLTVVALLMSSVYVLPMAVDSLLGFALFYLVVRDSQFRSNSQALWRDPLAKCGALLLGYVALSLFWSPQWDAKDVVQVSLRALLCLCFIYTLGCGASQNLPFMRLLWRAIALCALVSAVICIVYWFHAPPSDDRLNGLFRLNNAGKAGRMYAAALPIMVLGYMYDSGRWKLLLVIALIAALAALIITDTRAAWLGGVIGVTCLLIATWLQRPRKFALVAFGVGGLLLAALISVATHPNPDVSSLLLPRGDSLRLSIWANHLAHTLQEFPFFGGGFLAELPMMLGEKEIRGAHNMYLSTALQSGSLGLVLFVTCSLWAGLRLLHHLHLPIARLAFSLLVMGMIVHVFNGDRLIDKVNFIWFVTWFPLGIALSLRKHPGAENAGSTSV